MSWATKIPYWSKEPTLHLLATGLNIPNIVAHGSESFETVREFIECLSVAWACLERSSTAFAG
jgi:hypothetical protein